MSEDKIVTLDGQRIEESQLEEATRQLNNSQRIVEVKEDTFETVTRMRG